VRHVNLGNRIGSRASAAAGFRSDRSANCERRPSRAVLTRRCGTNQPHPGRLCRAGMIAGCSALWAFAAFALCRSDDRSFMVRRRQGSIVPRQQRAEDTPTFQAGHSWGGVLDSCPPFGAAGEVDGQVRPDREPVGASLVRSRDPLHTSPGVSVNLKDPSGDKGLLHNTRRSQPGRNHCCVWAVVASACVSPKG
jgi:hypothetical protein